MRKKDACRLGIAFGAGALTALLFPRLTFTVLGLSLLLSAGVALCKNSHKEC